MATKKVFKIEAALSSAPGRPGQGIRVKPFQVKFDVGADGGLQPRSKKLSTITVRVSVGELASAQGRKASAKVRVEVSAKRRRIKDETDEPGKGGQ